METETIHITVDNRIFLLGLDYLFRKLQKKYETETLLPIAENIKNDLNLEIQNFPIEGYYNETEELKKYFTIIRNLQKVEIQKEQEIKNIDEFKKLLSYTSSQIFGESMRGKLLPICVDSLGTALKVTYPNWNISNIVQKAYEISLKSNDYSLVGLACFIKDEVVITAVRESVVLYSGVIVGAAMVKIKIVYDWSVDIELQERANKFIQEFNHLTGFNLPSASPENAGVYYDGYGNNNIIHRCVNIAKNEPETKFYHWAIERDAAGKYYVKDFWDNHLWTTEEYKQHKDVVPENHTV